MLPDALSFVTREEGRSGFNYWAVEGSGSYILDHAEGRKLGDEFLAFIGQHPTYGNATLLSCIVDSMMRVRSKPNTSWGKHTTGLEIGFLAVVNEYAMASAALVGSK
jgi:hypothetical protein